MGSESCERLGGRSGAFAIVIVSREYYSRFIGSMYATTRDAWRGHLKIRNFQRRVLGSRHIFFDSPVRISLRGCLRAKSTEHQRTAAIAPFETGRTNSDDSKYSYELVPARNKTSFHKRAFKKILNQSYIKRIHVTASTREHIEL